MARRRGKKGVLSKIADYVSVATLLLGVAIAAAYFGKLGEREYQGRFIVMDGDSLQLDGIRFRLEGIDAPEAQQICRRSGSDWFCGREATLQLRRLMNEGSVVCRSLGLDKYERILAQCDAGSLNINQEMVAKGWAVSFGGYFSDEARARESKLGLWAGDFDRPSNWRKIYGDVLDAGDEHGLINGLTNKVRMVWRWLMAL